MINTETIRESLAREGIDLSSYCEQICKLVLSNPFSDRMSHLLKNPRIAGISVLNLQEEMLPPNCVGTALYTAHESKLSYPYYGYIVEFDELARKQKSIEKRGIWPTFCYRNDGRKIPGAVVVNYFENDCHAGIYLGEVFNNSVFFAQAGSAGKFEIEGASHFSDAVYYLPRVLK
jgi:hypothetical protein